MIDLETRLWASAARSVQDAGMDFTVPCSRNMRDLIGAGASVMRREGRLSESDLEAADASLARLTGEMVRLTRGLEEPGGKSDSGRRAPVRETALVGAKRLCPLWPFG
jgi:hypothetical protein